jgi:hypothetical protein
MGEEAADPQSQPTAFPSVKNHTQKKQNRISKKPLTWNQGSIHQRPCSVLVEIIRAELVSVQNQAIILVAGVLSRPDGVVVLSHVNLGVV